VLYREVYWWHSNGAWFFLFGSHDNPETDFQQHMFMMAPTWRMVPLGREAHILLRPLVDTRTCDNACLNGGICEYEANDNVHYCLSVHSLLRHVREGQPRAVVSLVLLTATLAVVSPFSHCGANCETASMCKNGGTCKYIVSFNKHRCVCPQTLSSTGVSTGAQVCRTSRRATIHAGAHLPSRVFFSFERHDYKY